MKLNEITDKIDDTDEEDFSHLKDLSNHIYGMRFHVAPAVIDKINDATFSTLVNGIERSTLDDFIVWHNWQDFGNSQYYVFDVVSTKGYQELATVTRKLRDVMNISRSVVRFYRSDNNLDYRPEYEDWEVKVDLK